MKLTLATIRQQVQNEADAYVLLERLRWGDAGPTCPHCGHDKAYFLKPANGSSRATGPKRTMSQRRVWKCAGCRKQFSVLTGTIFHGSKVPVATWLTVMVQMCSAKNGISAREVERMHGVTPETAWFILHRLREAMKRDPLVGMLRGTIVADETFVGGKSKNRYVGKRTPKPGRTSGDKVAVLSLVNRETGEVRSRVVPDVTGMTLRKAIEEHVDPFGSVLHTDAWRGCRGVGAQFDAHAVVDHSADEYVRYEPGVMVTTNQAEGYFSQLKRSIDGTHHHVSREHLPRYLAEFDFRYSTRKLSDSARLQQMVDQAAGRRLSYKPLTERP